MDRSPRSGADAPVRHLMHWPVATVPADASLRQVADVLAAEDIGAVLVVDDDEHLVGVVSERDLVRALADGADADHVWSGDVMSLETVVAAPDDTVAAVAHQMVTLRIRHVPVRRGSDVLGLVSIRDVVGALLDTVPAQG